MDQNEQRIVFEGDDSQHPAWSSQTTSGITQWIIAHSGGYIKEDSQARYVLIGFVIVALGISWFLFSGNGDKPDIPYGGGSNPQYSGQIL